MDMHTMALNEAAARRAQDYRTAEYWAEMVERESDRLERIARQDEWDALKGSPEHG